MTRRDLRVRDDRVVRRTSLLAAGAAVLLVAGLWLLLVHLVVSEPSGWFAYAPLADDGPVIGSIVLLDGPTLLGLGATWLGSLGLAAVGGHTLARRRA